MGLKSGSCGYVGPGPKVCTHVNVPSFCAPAFLSLSLSLSLTLVLHVGLGLHVTS